MDSDVTLWAPASATSVHLLRTVASSVGARFDLSIDEIDDLRLAVTEAASLLLTERPSGSVFSLRIGPEDKGTLRVTVTLDGPPASAQDLRSGGIERTLAWQVLRALGDDLDVAGDELEAGLTFTKGRRRASSEP